MKTRWILIAMLLGWVALRPASNLLAAPPTAADTDHPPLPRDSIYQLHVNMTDDAGRPIGLDVFKGHPVLIAMVYERCVSMCPLIVADVQRIHDGLSAEARAQTRVLMVSLDAKHDTPEALVKMAERHHVDRALWRFASARAPDVRAIAALLGVRYRELPDGQIAHSAVITALDQRGTPIARVEGTGVDASGVHTALEAAAMRATKP